MTDLLTGAGIPSRPNAAEGELTYWDLEVDLGGWVRVEVKFDRMCRRTGNLAVEYRNTRQGKPSGLLATRAELWVVVIPPRSIYVCLTEKLKEYFSSHPGRDVCGGDGNSAMRLYRAGEILPGVFTRLDDAPAGQLAERLKGVLGWG